VAGWGIEDRSHCDRAHHLQLALPAVHDRWPAGAGVHGGHVHLLAAELL